MKPDQLAQVFAKVILAPERWNGSRCWRWRGRARKEDFRAMFNKRYAYRILYEALIGPLPRGQGNASHHGCEHAWCVNPWHLKPLSQGDHLKVHGLVGDWGQRLKTHCPAGHAYDETNTYRRPDGGRGCKECGRRRSREYHERRLSCH